MGQAIQTGQPRVFNLPGKPSDEGVSNNLDGAKYWWQAKYKEMMAKIRGYTSSLCKMLPTILGCCDEDLRGKA